MVAEHADFAHEGSAKRMSNEPTLDSPSAAAMDAAATIPPAEIASAPGAGKKACANCGAPMFGPFCYACGQPEKGLIRHLASVMVDVADTVFNIDSRLFRSIGPLYFCPGFLTCEYFAGRRTRYLTPFRLFFFLCIISFFAIQSTLNIGDMNLANVRSKLAGNYDIGSAQNEAELEQRTHKVLDKLDKAIAKPGLSQLALEPMKEAATAVRAESTKRLAWLKMRDAALAKSEKPPADPGDEDSGISLDAIPGELETHPVQIAWLPAFANAKLSGMVGRAKENVLAAKRDPRRAIAGIFSVLPQTLFVMMPLFAVLLKFSYLFKRRLYMEHLMVALHSHAFVFLSLLLVTIVTFLIDWAATGAQWALPLLRLLRAAIWTWLPVYLFLMQKRVYGQGWLMTSLKYSFIGIGYIVMLSFGAVAAVLVSLAIA